MTQGEQPVESGDVRLWTVEPVLSVSGPDVHLIYHVEPTQTARAPYEQTCLRVDTGRVTAHALVTGQMHTNLAADRHAQVPVDGGQTTGLGIASGSHPHRVQLLELTEHSGQQSLAVHVGAFLQERGRAVHGQLEPVLGHVDAHTDDGPRSLLGAEIDLCQDPRDLAVDV